MVLIEILVLIFLCKKIGHMAMERGLKPGLWKFYTVLAWIGFEFLGLILGNAIIELYSFNDIIRLMVFALFCAFGGYLFVRHRLEQKETIQS